MARRYIVRYGIMRHVAEFTARPPQEDFARSDQVIIRTPRGMECGEVLSEATDRTREYLGISDPSGKLIRLMSPEDEQVRTDLWTQEREEFERCKEIIAERSMPMQLIDVERIFGGERVVFYFLSENRVDFRELVKELAKEFKTRIEMRQIGIRDEAKLLADYGDCGKPTCCNTHLTEMPPVSMKMAKVQKATLDPTKISGRCGRLKCCLRYEYDTYKEYQRELPKVGKWIVTKEGKGRVLAQEILAQKLLVSYEDNRRALVDAGDVITVVSTDQNKSNGSKA
ncbi:MAG: signal peptidase [Planctomycetaceae bacterium]|nr:signal peptidase [Planctomycetaceae bacterium]